MFRERTIKQKEKEITSCSKIDYSTVGAPDYIAPEVFSQKCYDKMVDWWSMGVIMFECLLSYPPQIKTDKVSKYTQILNECWLQSLILYHPIDSHAM